ncbi:MAG: hypothetical protein HWD85_01910 [Flavobacteriaceae bacterium]|nr:hypothetical protein [Flavobacteriaceae bacterium]
MTIISYGQESLIKNGDTWSYFDQGYLKNDWFLKKDFSTWKSGSTPIGYGDRIIITKINFGSNKKNKEITKYFSKEIYIKENANYKGYEFKLRRDDGAIIYVNGKELYRDNMPEGHITSLTRSENVVEGVNEDKFYTKLFDNSIFKKGKNIISIEIHQCNAASSDCIFSLELIAHTDPNILTKVIKEQLETKNKLEAKIDVLNYKFLLKNSLTQLEIYKSTNQNLKFLFFFMCCLLVVVVAIGLIFYLRYKKNYIDIENTVKELKNEILDKEKEMISLSTQLLYYNQYLKEIKADLSFAKTENTNKTLKDTIKQIEYILENDNEWELLKQHFNAVYANFYDNLLIKFPTLTETELRHCMFIKLHMQTKEIARILNVDPRSVQTSRYRIKKKLALNEEQDLRNYLIELQ